LGEAIERSKSGQKFDGARISEVGNTAMLACIEASA